MFTYSDGVAVSSGPIELSDESEQSDAITGDEHDAEESEEYNDTAAHALSRVILFYSVMLTELEIRNVVRKHFASETSAVNEKVYKDIKQ